MNILEIENWEEIKPNREGALKIGEYIKKYAYFIVSYENIISSNQFYENIGYIKECLLKYCNFILTLNGQSSVTLITRAEITNIADCAYLNTKKDATLGCKVHNYIDKKKYISDLLIQMLVSLFQKSKRIDNNLIDNTDIYIHELFKAIETYCHFMGMMHSGPIYSDYIKKLVDNLNTIFTEPIIYDRCYPSNRGYGCARMITIQNKTASTPQNNSKILLVSMNNTGVSTSSIEEGTNFTVNGGKKSRKYRNNKRLSKKQQ